MKLVPATVSIPTADLDDDSVFTAISRGCQWARVLPSMRQPVKVSAAKSGTCWTVLPLAQA